MDLFLHYCDVRVSLEALLLGLKNLLIQLSMQMAMALGLNSPASHVGMLGQYDPRLLHDTWVSVYQLNLYGSTLVSMFLWEMTNLTIMPTGRLDQANLYHRYITKYHLDVARYLI